MIRFRLSALLLPALLCTAMSLPVYAQEEAAKAKVQALLEKSAKEFLDAINDVNEQQWDFKGNGVRHSIGEEAEHVCFAEQELQRVIISALKSPADPKRAAALKGKEETVRALMLEGEKSPENFEPRGRLNSKLEVLEYFPQAHKKLMALLAGSKDLSTHIYKHPSKKYGDLTALQWFYYVAYHKERHVKQIEAIKAHADYPGRVRTARLESSAEAVAPPALAAE